MDVILSRPRHTSADLASLRRYLEPQETHTGERQYIKQKFPASEHGGRRFHARVRVPGHASAVDEQMHFPHLVAIELHLTVVLDVILRGVPPHAVEHYLQPSAFRLYPDLHLQVFRDR